MSEIDLRITPEQNELFEGLTAKFNIIRKGRRFGFTHGMMLFALEQLLLGNGPILWGDTINGNIDRYFQRYLLPILNKIGSKNFNWNTQKKELRIINQFTNDISSPDASLMDFRSADNPENWEGFGYKYIILNEAGIILKNEYLYKNAVLPMLLDFSESKLIAGGVPKGKTIKNGSEHPFFTLSKKAHAGDPRYREFVYTSYDSAVAQKDDIDELVDDLGGHNHPIVRQEIYGEFIDVVDLPFLHAFNEDIHIKEVQYDPMLPLYISWDFNIKSTALVIQFDEEIRILKEYHTAGIETICQDIMQDFKGYGYLFINGDASGDNNNAANETFYFKVMNALGLSYANFHVKKSNPRHKDSYNVSNHIIKHYPFSVHPSCKGLIRDCRMVQIIQQKNVIEIDKSDNTLTHFIDPLRYHLDYEHKDKILTLKLHE